MNPPEPDPAEDIRRRMAQIRSEVRDDVQGVVAAAQEYADWRSYVRANPWACVAAAAAVGYLLVPPRYGMHAPDMQKLKTLVAESVPQPQQARRGGFVGAALSAVGPIVLRQALGLAGRKLQEILSQHQDLDEAADEDFAPSRTHPR